MSLFRRKKSIWERVAPALPVPPTEALRQRSVRTGLQVGAGLLALSAISAATSAARRREE